MAQTEEMKRLLLKGGIVGFEWHTGKYEPREEGTHYNRLQDGYIKILHKRPLDKEWFDITWCSGEDYIEYDSSELGTKVNDEWWFIGDKVELKYPISDHVHKGILYFETGCMLIKFDNYMKHEDISLLSIRGWITRPNDIGYCKRIGNIYEEKMSNDKN